MPQSAKLFKNGRSQAVRIPLAFRFDCEEVYIRKDEVTGDVILSRKPGSWDDLFKLLETFDVPKDFMDDRDQGELQERELF